jgi:hypothetical protein
LSRHAPRHATQRRLHAPRIQVPAEDTTTMKQPAGLCRSFAALAAAAAAMMLAACGAEVAAGAAAVGGLQAQQATQARAQQQQVVDGLKAGQAAGLARSTSAAD